MKSERASTTIKGLVELKDGEDIVIMEDGTIDLPYSKCSLEQAVDLIGKLQKAIEIARSTNVYRL